MPGSRLPSETRLRAGRAILHGVVASLTSLCVVAIYAGGLPACDSERSTSCADWLRCYDACEGERQACSNACEGGGIEGNDIVRAELAAEVEACYQNATCDTRLDVLQNVRRARFACQ